MHRARRWGAGVDQPPEALTPTLPARVMEARS